MDERKRPRDVCGNCRHWALLFDGDGVEVGACASQMVEELGMECATKAALDWLYWHSNGAGLPACDGFEEV